MKSLGRLAKFCEKSIDPVILISLIRQRLSREAGYKFGSTK